MLFKQATHAHAAYLTCMHVCESRTGLDGWAIQGVLASWPAKLAGYMAGSGRQQHTSAAAAGSERAHSSETLARQAAGPGITHDAAARGTGQFMRFIQLHPAASGRCLPGCSGAQMMCHTAICQPCWCLQSRRQEAVTHVSAHKGQVITRAGRRENPRHSARRLPCGRAGGGLWRNQLLCSADSFSPGARHTWLAASIYASCRYVPASRLPAAWLAAVLTAALQSPNSYERAKQARASR